MKNPEDPKLSVPIGSSPSTASTDVSVGGGISGVRISTSAPSHIRRCFIKPLREMNQDNQTFILLIAVFAFYEAHIRHKCKITERNLRDDSPFFDEMAIHFGLSREAAQRFWRTHRHGLAHSCFAYTRINDDQPPIRYVWNRNHDDAILAIPDGFHVNPFKFRDVVVDIVEREISVWDKAANRPTTIIPIPLSDGLISKRRPDAE